MCLEFPFWVLLLAIVGNADMQLSSSVGVVFFGLAIVENEEKPISSSASVGAE